MRAALRWRVGPTTTFRLSVHVTLASLGAPRIVAAAAAGGLAVTSGASDARGSPFRDAFVRVLGLNTLLYLVFAVGAWSAALLATFGVLGEAPRALTVPWLLVVPICVLAACIVMAPARVGRLTEPTGHVLRRGLAYAIAGTAWVREAIGDPVIPALAALVLLPRAGRGLEQAGAS